MKKWEHWFRLAFRKATLIRTLSEIALEDIGNELLSDISIERVLLAGGMKGGLGSEYRVIDSIGSGNKPEIIVANIDREARPDLIVDLASTWPLKESQFDLVVSNWVLEHIETPQNFFQEAYRAIKAGGFLILAVPFIHQKHGSPFDYWRYTDTALISLAKSCGFSQVGVKCVEGGPFVACLSLFVRLPVVGLILYILARMLDHALVWISQVTGKGQQLVTSYPISCIAWSQK